MTLLYYTTIHMILWICCCTCTLSVVYAYYESNGFYMQGVWHLHGYDKLKPYGFVIHGCIDGYSGALRTVHTL